MRVGSKKLSTLLNDLILPPLSRDASEVRPRGGSFGPREWSGRWRRWTSFPPGRSHFPLPRLIKASWSIICAISIFYSRWTSVWRGAIQVPLQLASNFMGDSFIATLVWWGCFWVVKKAAQRHPSQYRSQGIHADFTSCIVNCYPIAFLLSRGDAVGWGKNEIKNRAWLRCSINCVVGEQFVSSWFQNVEEKNIVNKSGYQAECICSHMASGIISELTESVLTRVFHSTLYGVRVVPFCVPCNNVVVCCCLL